MSNQPIVFNVRYTPYRLPRSASAEVKTSHAEERTFYDMTGTKNIFDYITRKEKTVQRSSALDYFQKSTRVFNKDGMIPIEEIDRMRARLKENKGNIWHGFISFNEEESHKIDTPEKCIAFVKSTFGTFFKAAHLDEKNLDLMCSLHVDRPHHLHIHFMFWEKEPRYKSKDGKEGLKYRSKGMLDKAAIDNMFVKSGIFVSEGKDHVHTRRQKALKKLRGMTAVRVAMASSEEIKKEILALAKDLPDTGRLTYGSKDMEPFRERVDKIVELLLAHDPAARRADRKFFEALAERDCTIKNICGQSFAFSNRGISEAEMEENLPTYHYKIDDSNIRIVEDIKEDYKRRQGNLVLRLAKFIKPEYYERKQGKKYKVNDVGLKRRLAISEKKVGRLIKNFLASFGRQSELLERDFSHRLQDIEKEIERERKKGKEDNNKAE